MSNLSQKSFAGGVLSPALRGNTTIAKYQQALKTGRNGYIRKDGGFTNRPGSEFISEVKWSTDNVRLLKFVFNDSQTYILEFSSYVMRVYKDGTQQKESGKAITGITKASQCEITCVAHGYTTDSDVYLSGILGMTELNGRWFKVVSTGANTFKIKDMAASAYINSSPYTTYVSGGLAEKVYEITTPWTGTELDELDFDQSADVITIVHPSYAPRELSRTGDTSWTLSNAVFEPNANVPVDGGASAGAGAVNSVYYFTAVDRYTLEESLPSLYASHLTISAITKANPGVFTVGAHGFGTDMNIAYIDEVVGMTEVNKLQEYYAETVSPTTVKLKNIYTGDYLDTTNFTTYTSGGKLYIRGKRLSAHSFPVTVYAESPFSNIAYYNVYRNPSGNFNYWGLIGTSLNGEFVDSGITPSTEKLLSFGVDLFRTSNNYPSTVRYAQQRRYFGNTNNNPDMIWGSQTNSPGNFIPKIPVNDADSFSATLATKRVSEIQFLIEIDKLIAMSSGSEIVLHGGQNGFITPTEVNSRATSSNGCSSIRPLILDDTALYVQARGTIVRDLFYNTSSDGTGTVKGNDLTVAATHFFEGYTIVDWDYQQNPHPLLWAVRSDGKVLTLTYDRTSSMIAWTISDFQDGLVENVCVVPEGTEDKVYFVVKRTINGRSTKYIERLSSRYITNKKDMTFLDSFISYDGRNTTAKTMTLSGGSTWLYDETITCTASASTFASTDVGNEVHFYDADGVLLGRFSINAYSSATVVTGKFDRTVPAAIRTAATTYWALAVDQITNLWHLEGLDVSVFGDGSVTANPNNASYTTVTVSSGTITLDQCYGVIHVGLPYITDLETLDIDTSSGGKQANASQLVSEVSVRLYESMGFWAGSKAPSDDDTDPLEGLYEVKIRDEETWDQSVELNSEVQTVQIQSTYNKNGRVFLRNIEPVPLTVLGVRPTGLLS